MKRIFFSLTAIFFLFNIHAQDLNLKRLSEQELKERERSLKKVQEFLENSKNGEAQAPLPTGQEALQEQQSNNKLAGEEQDDVLNKPSEPKISEEDLEKSSRKYSEKLRQQIQEMIAERGVSPAERSKATPPQRTAVQKAELKEGLAPPAAPDSLSYRKDIPESGWKGKRISKGERKDIGEVIKKVPAPPKEIKTTAPRLSEEELKLRKEETLAKFRKEETPEERQKSLVEQSKQAAEEYATKQNFGEIGLLAANESDSLALVAIRDAFPGLENYWPVDQSISFWSGVYLNFEGRVEGINVTNFGLSGAFPDETGNLSALRSLEFGGDWDTYGITALPATISNLTNLEWLSGYNNEISSLPAGFETLKNLRFLDLGGNNFEGPMPEQIFGLDSLESLYFWSNNLTSIGEGVGNLQFLRIIELGWNQLESLPDSIQYLDNAYALNLSGNKFKTFPDQIAGMQKLEFLSLYGNAIFDEIPATYFSDLTMLRDFDFGNNRVFGALPATIADADSLQQIHGYQNILNKPLPPEIGSIQNIRYLDLGGNKIPGAIPAEIGQATTLNQLYLGSNELEGPIPAELGNLVNLEVLHLDFNANLGGELPVELGNLTRLHRVNLSYCNFSGTIPASFGSLANLQALYLNDNSFSGTIPDSLGRGLNNLMELYIQNNQFTGLPADVSGLYNLYYIEAYSNNLEFDDFEPFAQLFANFYISPQKEVATQVMNPATGTAVELNATVGGTSNNYYWFRNGEPLDSITTSVLSIKNFSLDSAGYYSVWVNSDSVYGMELYRDFEVYYSETVLAQDSLALVALYEATNPHGDAGWYSDEFWLESPVAMWEGVILEEGRVVGLDLPHNNLQGGIPPEIADLTALRYLNLFGNDLDYLASEFYNLTNLTYLDLDDNNFGGGISPLIGNLTNLDTLWIGRNPWEGEIPEEIYSLTKLKLLGLYMSDLSGNISPLIGNLVNLGYLHLGGNDGLRGSLPAEILNLPKLEFLILWGLGRMDPGLPDLSTLANLKVLNIGYSSFLQGDIPAFVGNMTNLRSLYLAGTDLSSGMESLLFVTFLSNLKYLSLYNTGLSGNFTHNFDVMDSLEVVWLGGNEITGFSAELLSNPNLKVLDFGNNRLTGFPPLDMPQLEHLILAGNELTSLPDLSAMDSLYWLNVADNNLTFDDLLPFESFLMSGGQLNASPQATLSADTSFYLPAGGNYDIVLNLNDTSSSSYVDWYYSPFHSDENFWIENYSDTLKIQNASNPGHDGSYSASVYNSIITPYTGLYLESGVTEIQVVETINEQDSLNLVTIFEHFNGHLWDDKAGWLEEPVESWAGVDAFGGRVRGIYLYGMHGEIPLEIANLDSLEHLQIIDGELTGSIPAELFNLEKLRHFDVGWNNLTGNIPETIGNATNLETFGIAGNRLTGTIPTSMGDLTNLRRFWADNNPFTNEYLEGPIPAGWAANYWESFLVQHNRFNELPVGLDTAFRYVYGNLSYNDFDMADLVRGVGTEPYYNNGYVDLYGSQNFRRALVIDSIAEGSEAILSVERLHPDDEFTWHFQHASWGQDHYEYLENTATDSFLVISDWENFKNGKIFVTVTNPNIGIWDFREFSTVETLNTHTRRFASGGEHNPVGDGSFHTPISSVTGPPDNFPLDYQQRNWWHNQSQPDFDTLTLFFDDPIPINYFRHHGNEINVRSIAFRGANGEEVMYEINRHLYAQYGYRINGIPMTAFPVTEVELILSNGSIDAFEIGDNGMEGIVQPWIDDSYAYSNGQEAYPYYTYSREEDRYIPQGLPLPNGYIGVGYIRSEMEYIYSGVNYLEDNVYIERSTDPETGFVPIDTFRLNWYYNDLDLPEANTTYYYRAQAYINGEVSEYSNTVKNCNTMTNIPGLTHPEEGRATRSYWKVTSQGTGDFVNYTGQRDSVIFVNNRWGENVFGIEGPFDGGFFDQFKKYDYYSEYTYFSDNCGEIKLYGRSSWGEFYADSLWGTYENDTLYLHWREAVNGVEGLSKFVYVGPVEEDHQEGELHKPSIPYDFEAFVFSSDSIRMHWGWGYDDDYYDDDDYYQDYREEGNQRYYQEFSDPQFFIIQRAVGKTGAFANFDTVSVAELEGRGDYFVANLGDNEIYRYRLYAGNESGLSYPSNERGVVHRVPRFDPLFSVVSFDDRKTSYGGAFADIDNDGDQDLYISNAFESPNNFLYENLGNGEFAKLTTPIAVKERGFTRSAAFGDFDNDGFPDLFVPGGGSAAENANTSDRVYRNTGTKSFEIATADPVSNYSSGETGVWVDLDNDGHLDLVTSMGAVFKNTGAGQLENYDTLKGFDGSHIAANYGFIVLTLRSLDFDMDGDMDIYAPSDYYGNRLYLNDGTGKLTLNSDYSISDGHLRSRGGVWFDADNDSDLDLFIGDGENPGLYLNETEVFTYHFIGNIIDQEYDDVIGGRGVTTGDFDNDGNKDIVWVVEGRPYLLMNQGNLSFHVVMEDEQFFPEMRFSSHVSTADVNNDGSLDLLFLGGDFDGEIPNYLYLNNANENGWINLNLKGVESNASAIGAKVFVTADGKTQFDEVTSQNGIGSGNSLSLEFGVGAASVIDKLRVEWPSGDATELTNVEVNQFLTLAENVAVIASDSSALVALYEATGGADWAKNTGWTTRPAREWYGVNFNKEGNVTSIVLSNNNLTGSIPSEITSLTSLEVLNLSGNSLVGGIPDSIGNVTALKNLTLNDNDLDGSIPASITKLSGLANIDLYNNRMKGELPVNIGDLTALKQFEIQNNEFIGFLPSSFGSLNNLEILNIGNNIFEGAIPEGLGDAANLQILNIGRNSFTGSLPATLSQLSELVEFRADSNRFSGDLPAEFAEWTGIGLIDVSYNELTGSLQPFTAYDSISLINVSHNKFTELSDFSGSSADSVIARYNYLDFGDFESSISAIESGLVLVNPQDSLYERIDSLHNVGKPINIFFSVEGSFNTYQWYLNGEILEGETGLAVDIQNPDSPNEGEYVLEIKNEIFPEITLYTSPFNLKLASLERDRQALIDLYNATNGEQWTNNSEWNSEDLSTWFGVTVEADRVTRLELPDNNLDGRVPRSFVDLSGLKAIDLSGNSLRSFWDISQFLSLDTVAIANNRLAFRDILPNVKLGEGVISYAPQRRYDVTINDTIQAGDDYNVSVSMPGSGLQYQWYFGPLLPGQPFNNEVSPIENANSRQYLVEDIDYEKQGTYRVEVTHPEVPGLTITSRNRNLWAATDLYGTVYADDSQTPLTEGEVIIYRIKADGPYIAEDTVSIEVNGEYAFDNVVLGDFIVLTKPVRPVDPQPGDIVPVQTYYEKTEFDTAASVLEVREKLEGVDIQMVNYTVDDKDPVGATIFGTVESEFEEDVIGDEEGERVLARRKVKKAGCSMRRRTRGGGGRTGQDEEYELYAYVETDDEGVFDFTGIPEGEYLLNIQYPGIPMDETSDIKFVIGGDVQEQKFSAAALITEAGISIEAYEILSVPKPYLKDVQLYPNPTDAILTVDFVVNRRLDDLKMVVLTVEGVTVLEETLDHKMGLQSSKVDLSRYNSGFYFLIFTDEAGSFRHQIKIGKK